MLDVHFFFPHLTNAFVFTIKIFKKASLSFTLFSTRMWKSCLSITHSRCTCWVSSMNQLDRRPLMILLTTRVIPERSLCFWYREESLHNSKLLHKHKILPAYKSLASILLAYKSLYSRFGKIGARFLSHKRECHLKVGKLYLQYNCIYVNWWVSLSICNDEAEFIHVSWNNILIAMPQKLQMSLGRCNKLHRNNNCSNTYKYLCAYTQNHLNFCLRGNLIQCYYKYWTHLS